MVRTLVQQSRNIESLLGSVVERWMPHQYGLRYFAQRTDQLVRFNESPEQPDFNDSALKKNAANFLAALKTSDAMLPMHNVEGSNWLDTGVFIRDTASNGAFTDREFRERPDTGLIPLSPLAISTLGALRLRPPTTEPLTNDFLPQSDNGDLNEFALFASRSGQFTPAELQLDTPVAGLSGVQELLSGGATGHGMNNDFAGQATSSKDGTNIMGGLSQDFSTLMDFGLKAGTYAAPLLPAGSYNRLAGESREEARRSAQGVQSLNDFIQRLLEPLKDPRNLVTVFLGLAVAALALIIARIYS